MRAELVSIPTDAESLDGLFYLPENGQPKAAALIFHGNCHNFYTCVSKFLPEVLAAHNIASLAFNRRGHDMVTSLVGRSATGGSFQMAHEGIADNRYASDWLDARGFKNPIVIGHSNGGMLAAQHCGDDYGKPRAQVLMSAHRGGRDWARLANAEGNFAKDRHQELTAQAEAMVAEGRGRELMLLPGWWWAISAESFLDRDRNTPDTVENAARLRAPTLYLRGDKEIPEMYPAERYAANASAPCEVRILPNSDHFYTGCETEVATQVAQWLQAYL